MFADLTGLTHNYYGFYCLYLFNRCILIETNNKKQRLDIFNGDFSLFPPFFFAVKRVQSRLENIDGTEGERGHIAAAVAADKRRKKFQSLKLTWEAAS